ncbi:MAG: hypothetical protein LKG23_00040 [Nitrospira sp.]|jgi:hypothetical protein|nr:hypothetical protein [Nitrospira sp.]
MLKQGWLDRQISKANQEVNSWPQWMKQAAKIEALSSEKRPKNDTQVAKKN